MDSQQPRTVSQASIYDTLRVMQTVVAPTSPKGSSNAGPGSKPSPSASVSTPTQCSYCRNCATSTEADHLPSGSRSEPKCCCSTPRMSPRFISNASSLWHSKKNSSLGHFELNHILVADPERRAQLRPVHEQALATSEHVHPFAAHFQEVINEEVQSLFHSPEQDTTLDWPIFSAVWSRIIRRIVLGDAARSDDELTNLLDDIRRRANWGFLSSFNTSKLDAVQSRLSKYIQAAKPTVWSPVFPVAPPLKPSTWNPKPPTGSWPSTQPVSPPSAPWRCATSHPDAQAKIAAEVDSTTNVQNNMKYTRSILLESLRLYPTTPAILRELNEDSTALGNQPLSKGTGVIIFAPFFHRDT